MEQPGRARYISLTFLIGFGFGIFAGVALALLAVALVSDSGAPDAQAGILAPATDTPGIDATATPEARPRSNRSVEVRLGPGPAFAIVGTLDRGQLVDVAGRDGEAAWIAIRFPPNSTGRGWIPADSLDGLAAPDELALVAPTPLARSVEAPTPPPLRPIDQPSAGLPSLATPTSRVLPSSPTPPAPPTPAAGGPIDLVVNRIALLPDGRVSVTVGNRGPGELNGQSVFVAIRDLANHAETLISQQRSLAVGATLTLESSTFRIDRETDVVATVDPFTTVQDPNRGNNSLSATLSPPPTAVPVQSPAPGQ